MSETSQSFRQQRSAIWKQFRRISEYKAKCNLCNSEYSYKGGTTSNLRKHLQSRHPTVIFEEISSDTIKLTQTVPLSSHAIASTSTASSFPEESILLSTATSTAGISEVQKTRKRKQISLVSYVSRPISLPRQKKINNLVLNIIAKDLQPFSVVEDIGFKELLLELEPCYKIPSRFTLTNSLLPSTYEMVVKKLKNILETADFVATTTDAWTSVANESYIGVTAHFITSKWNFHSFVLECFCCETNHTSLNLSNELQRVIAEWNLTHKIYACTTDSAANMISAIKISGWAHIPCFAHTLNLIIKTGLAEIDSIRNKVRAIVEYFNRSTQAKTKFFSIQKQMEPNSLPLKLKQEVVTRWNSTFYMFERIVKLQEPLTATVGLLHNPVVLLSEVEWITLKEICKILQPFEQITVEMSAEKSVTLSKVIIIVNGLRSVLDQIRTNISQNAAYTLIDTLMESMSTRFGNIEFNGIFAKASFLDPRFKTKAFNSNEALKRVKEEIQQEVITLINKGKDAETSTSAVIDTEIGTFESAGSETIDESETCLIWKEFDKSMKSKELVNSPTAAAITEIKTYIAEAFLTRKENPLEWWKQREMLYPRLSKLAKKYLSVVATSVPCERLFSKAGNLISEKRSRLKGKNVQRIMFLHCNQELF